MHSCLHRFSVSTIWDFFVFSVNIDPPVSNVMKHGFLIRHEEQLVNLSVLSWNTNYVSETINSNTVNLISIIGQQVSHQRWIWGFRCMQMTKHASKDICPELQSQSGSHHKSKTGVSAAQRKAWCPPRLTQCEKYIVTSNIANSNELVKQSNLVGYTKFVKG